MSLITVPDAFPSMVRAIGRAALIIGRTCDERALTEALVPDWLITNTSDRTKARKRVRQALRSAVAAGMLQDSGGTFDVVEPWQSAFAHDATPDEFATTLALQLRCTSAEGLGDLTRTAAWLLLQDPFAPPLTPNRIVDLFSEQFTNTEPPFKPNDVRIQMAAMWVHYLGIGVRWSLGPRWSLMPDLTRLILRIGKTLPDLHRSAGIADWLALARRHLPFLPGGDVSLEVARSSKTPAAPDSSLAPSLALALQRLELQGVVTLETASDAKHEFSFRAIDRPRHKRRVSRIAWKRQAVAA